MKTNKISVTRSKWSSEKAFILAAAAAAVGLGNIWRFPYVAGENGGAAFILAYLVAVIAVGFPIMLTEVGAGEVERGGVVRSFRALSKRAAGFGWLVIGLTTVILSYYLVVTGWTLGFAVDSLNGDVGTFEGFTSGFKPLIFYGIALGITALVAFNGVKLIERTTRYLIPVLLGIIILMAIYGMTLSGAGKALDFLFSPDFSALTSTKLWALAFGQAFYSLAIGQGYHLTYGSYLPKKINVPRATAWIAGIETSVALIAGLMIFPIVFTFGLNPSEGTELSFTTLPFAFKNMAAGPVIAVIFFSLLFLAAISSCIASMQVIKTSLREELNLTNAKAVLFAVLLLLPLGVISALSFTPMEVELFGRPFLEVMDLVTANQVVVVSGLAGGAIISWSAHRSNMMKLFSRKYWHIAWYVVIATRFLWVLVLGILVASLLAG